MLTATVLALAAAALHATWNFLVKTGEERDLVGWGQFGFGAVLAWPLMLAVGPPGLVAVPFLAASSGIHVVYLLALTRSYHHGDFSLSYPLARGSGALLAGLGGVLFLDDRLGGWSWLAVGIVVGGLGMLVGRPIERLAVGWALFTGMTIGTYTVIDAAGARRTDGVQYGLVLMSTTAAVLTVVNLARGRAPAFAASFRRSWPRYAVAGICTTAAYTLVLAAVRLAPVGYVATLRESSVVLVGLLGWLVLKEGLGARRSAAAVVMTAGLALLVATR